MHDEPQWVQIRSCNWLHEAELVRSVLASADIIAVIPDEYTVGVQPFYGAMLGGIRVLVRQEDAERAKELLDSATP